MSLADRRTKLVITVAYTAFAYSVLHEELSPISQFID